MSVPRLQLSARASGRMLAWQQQPRVVAAARGVPRPRQAVKVAASTLTVKDEQTQVAFPLATKFWAGGDFRCLGAGARVKKILMLSVKVYSIALFVEAEKAAKELGIRQRGGFFASDEDFCDALMDGAFDKALVLHLVRDVEGQQFLDALNESLAPRLAARGESGRLDDLKQFFADKKLSAGTEVLMFWSSGGGDLELRVVPGCSSTGGQEYAGLKPEAQVRSVGLCRALFEVFLSGGSVVPDARRAWVEGAKKLLDSENVKRATR